MPFLSSLLARVLLILAFGLVCTITSADEAQDLNALLKSGQVDAAAKRADTYLAAQPKDVEVRFIKGLILTRQGKNNEAIALFSELTQDFPELPEPYNNLAVLYAGQGQYDKARAALEMALRANPGNAVAYENLGDVYARLASQAYEKSLQLDARNSGAQTKLNLIRELPGQGKKTTAAK